MLESTYTFEPVNSLVGLSGYPAIVEQDNGDGTFQGHLDLGNATLPEKLAALADFKFGAAEELLGI